MDRIEQVQQIYEKADACITNHNSKGLYGCYVELFDILEPIMRNVIYKEFSGRGTPCTYEDVEDLLQEMKFALFRFSVYNYRKSKNKETYYKISDKETTEVNATSFNAYCI